MPRRRHKNKALHQVEGFIFHFLFLCFLSFGFLCVYFFFQLFRNAECRSFGSGDLDFSLGGRIVSYAGFTLTDFESTESDELYLISLYKSIRYYIKDSFDCLFSIFLCHFSFLGYCCDEFCFVHN